MNWGWMRVGGRRGRLEGGEGGRGEERRGSGEREGERRKGGRERGERGEGMERESPLECQFSILHSLIYTIPYSIPTYTGAPKGHSFQPSSFE